MADVRKINGNRYSWGSISVKLNGDRLYGYTDLSFSSKRTRELLYGMGQDHAPIGRTRGKFEPGDVKLTGYSGSVQNLLDSLTAAAGTGEGPGDVVFEIVCQYIETDETEITVNLTGCVIVEESSSHSEGTEGMKTEITIQPINVLRNGKSLASGG